MTSWDAIFMTFILACVILAAAFLLRTGLDQIREAIKERKP
jgi:hypothetical protein